MSKNSISLKKKEEKKKELILGLKIKMISKKKKLNEKGHSSSYRGLKYRNLWKRDKFRKEPEAAAWVNLG